MNYYFGLFLMHHAQRVGRRRPCLIGQIGQIRLTRPACPARPTRPVLLSPPSLLPSNVLPTTRSRRVSQPRVFGHRSAYHILDTLVAVELTLPTELSSVALGGTVTSVSDELFAEAFHLLLVGASARVLLNLEPRADRLVDSPWVACTEPQRSIRS